MNKAANNPTHMWDQRYAENEYAYGTQPNMFFKETLDNYPGNGSILMPGEGEGRNAIYAAEKGLKVTAFDISENGKKKALLLAIQRNVQINYEVGDFLKMNFESESFDKAALLYAHFPADLRGSYHHKIGSLIRKGGLLILEGFSKTNLELREKNPGVGGPGNPQMLFSMDQIRSDFPDFKILLLEEKIIELKEGKFHNGQGSVIRFIGEKQ